MPPKRSAPVDSTADTADTGSSSSVKRSKRAEATASVKAVEAASTASTNEGWKMFNEVLTFTPPGGIKGNSRVYGFDIDDTIITPKSGKTFAQNAADWIFWNPVVPQKLLEFHQKGYKIVFFSNQGGIGTGKTDPADFKKKLNAVMAAIPGVPVQIYASTQNGKYRKPATGMWGMFAKGGNAGVEPDLKLSAYIGDAAGRAKGWKAGCKKDFSDSDRKFAINLGVQFLTPDEFFLGEKPVAFTLEGADPKVWAKDGPLYEPATAKLIAPTQELVIMVGYPGSGKSFFSVKELEGRGKYLRVNRDTLKTKEKCLKVAEEGLSTGSSVVIDNTNPDAETRGEYIALARKYKVPARAFVMQTSFDEAMHNNQFREIVSNGQHEHVPTMVYHMYKKKYVEPTTTEGFSEIVKTHFRPKFDDPATEKLFFMWTPL